MFKMICNGVVSYGNEYVDSQVTCSTESLMPYSSQELESCIHMHSANRSDVSCFWLSRNMSHVTVYTWEEWPWKVTKGMQRQCLSRENLPAVMYSLNGFVWKCGNPTDVCHQRLPRKKMKFEGLGKLAVMHKKLQECPLSPTNNSNRLVLQTIGGDFRHYNHSPCPSILTSGKLFAIPWPL